MSAFSLLCPESSLAEARFGGLRSSGGLPFCLNPRPLPHYIFLQRSERPPLAGRNPLGLAYQAAAGTRGRCVQAPLALLSLIPGSQWMNTSPGASYPLKQAGTISCWKVKQGGCVQPLEPLRMSLWLLLWTSLATRDSRKVSQGLRSTIWNKVKQL